MEDDAYIEHWWSDNGDTYLHALGDTTANELYLMITGRKRIEDATPPPPPPTPDEIAEQSRKEFLNKLEGYRPGPITVSTSLHFAQRYDWVDMYMNPAALQAALDDKLVNFVRVLNHPGNRYAEVFHILDLRRATPAQLTEFEQIDNTSKNYE